MWYDEVKKLAIRSIRKKEILDEKEELYETRWVWYRTLLVVELFIIILLLLYIAI